MFSKQPWPKQALALCFTGLILTGNFALYKILFGEALGSGIEIALWVCTLGVFVSFAFQIKAWLEKRFCPDEHHTS